MHKTSELFLSHMIRCLVEGVRVNLFQSTCQNITPPDNQSAQLEFLERNENFNESSNLI